MGQICRFKPQLRVKLRLWGLEFVMGQYAHGKRKPVGIELITTTPKDNRARGLC